MDEIITGYEKEGEIISLEELKSEELSFSNNKKRIFVYDNVKYSFFLILNPPKRSFIRAFADEKNYSEIQQVLKLTEKHLEANGYQGILKNNEHIEKNFKIFQTIKCHQKNQKTGR